MPQEKIQNLMTELHEHFADAEPSPEQQALLQEFERRVTSDDTAYSEFMPLETLELLIDEMAEQHPRTAAVMQELLTTLKNIGV
jgi:hypothetical protein